MSKWLLILVPALVSYYTVTLGLWAWKKGNRGGGIGVFLLAAFNLALAAYGIFFRTGF